MRSLEEVKTLQEIGNRMFVVILVRSTGIQPIINYAICYRLDPQTTSEDDASLMYLLPTTAIADRGIYPARNDKLLVGLVNPTYRTEKIHPNALKTKNKISEIGNKQNSKSQCIGSYSVSGYTRSDGTKVGDYIRSCGAKHNN